MSEEFRSEAWRELRETVSWERRWRSWSRVRRSVSERTVLVDDGVVILGRGLV